jgi:hypothetical protein
MIERPMWRSFIYVVLFAAISLPRAGPEDWILMPIGLAFAAGLVLVPNGIARAIAAWPRATPRLLIAIFIVTIVVMVGSFFCGLHPLAWMGIVIYAGCAATLMLVIVSIGGWWKTREQPTRC